MVQKTILLVDDEQAFLEGLADALELEGYRILKARTGTKANEILARERVDLVTVDVMMPYDEAPSEVPSQTAGLQIISDIKHQHPQLDVFCISVVTDPATIIEIKKMGATFLKKGEVPLKTVLARIQSRLTGIAYRDPSDR